jgi:sulfur-oxidizing protein SoxZ
MGSPMRIRAVQSGEITEVKVLIKHDMETGQRKDADGKVVPPHFIRTVIAKCNGRTVFEAETGTSISKDPFISFKFRNGNKGDKVAITWNDNKGDSRTDEVAIT